MLINITGGYDLTLFELDEAANRIREEVDPDANIIVGSTLDTEMEGAMRVSVVATGIDASESVHDIPVPRRSMAAPLQSVEKVEEKVAPVAAKIEEDLVAREERHEPEPQPEPSLFEDIEPQVETAAAPRREEPRREATRVEVEDDLPPPAYQPRVAEFKPHDDDYSEAPEHEQFMAPRAPGAGTPTPEALARLQAAVQKVPAHQTRPGMANHQPHEKARFGINSLINRMTGHQGEAPQERSATVTRQQPQMRAVEAAPEPSPEQEKIEIPAFLRRQAN